MSLRHAILGFLSLKPLTGYDLKKHFDASVRHFWSANQAQIYRELAHLAEAGYAQIRVVDQHGRPDRREHHITNAGRAELDAWLRTPSEPHPVREPFLVKVFFAGRLPATETAALVESRITAAEQQLDVLTTIAMHAFEAAADHPVRTDRLMALATLENGINHTAAELAWLRDLRADLDDPPAAAARMRQRLTAAVHTNPPHHLEQP